MDFIFEQEFLTTKRLDPNLLVAGVDEVGRGPLAGPVVACAVALPNKSLEVLLEVKDSKALSKSKRNKIYEALINTVPYGLGIVEAPDIDRLNILNATKLAMVQAADELLTKCNPKLLLVDGRDKIIIKNSPLQVYPIIKGDGKSLTIAAASVIAKVTRDNIMERLSKQDNNKVYGWEQNAGYGTAHHRAMIEEYGLTQHHRKSFTPIKEMVGFSR